MRFEPHKLLDVNGDGTTDLMVGSPRGGELFLPE